jgi:hypothetical protein
VNWARRAASAFYPKQEVCENDEAAGKLMVAAVKTSKLVIRRSSLEIGPLQLGINNQVRDQAAAATSSVIYHFTASTAPTTTPQALR